MHLCGGNIKISQVNYNARYQRAVIYCGMARVISWKRYRSTPGFEVLFAVAGILAVAYMVRRKK
jgi:PGF-CTERM protein